MPHCGIYHLTYGKVKQTSRIIRHPFIRLPRSSRRHSPIHFRQREPEKGGKTFCFQLLTILLFYDAGIRSCVGITLQ